MVISTQERIARGLEIAEFGSIERLSEHWFRVASRSNSISLKYMVHIGNYHYCSCPDFGYRMAKRGFVCKHIIAVYISWEV